MLALLIAGAAALASAWVPWIRLLDERVRDGLTSLVALHEPVQEVTLIDIDEHSLQRVGPWPWSRNVLADLIEQLLGPLGARAVALDIVLPEPADPAGDDRLAVLAAHGPLTLSQVLDFAVRNAPVTTGALARGDDARPGLAQATGYVGNHSGLGRARCIGHIGVQPDGDGVLRRVFLQAQFAGRAYRTLALQLVDCVDPARARRAQEVLGQGGSSWRIPFRRQADSFVALPADAILDGSADAGLIRGRYVLIGSSAVGLSDYVATPLQPVTAGVLVHAQVLTELLNPTPGLGAESGRLVVASGLVLGVCLIALGWLAGPTLGSALLAFTVLGWLAACALSFRAGSGPWVLPPLAAYAGYTLGWVGVEFADARRLSRRAINTLSHYVAEPVLALLIKQGLRASLTPSQRDITVLVADMADYTRLTRQSALEQSAQLTTEFLECITGPVLRSFGTLDRYTGDGLIAFWGAPLDDPLHPAHAYQAAQEMLQSLKALNESRALRGEPPIRMRIGIESGTALVGDLGSSARSVYTAVGTCINLASRLQELARDMGETVVIGPQAQRQIPVNLRPLVPQQIRGLAEPLQVYSLPDEGSAG